MNNVEAHLSSDTVLAQETVIDYLVERAVLTEPIGTVEALAGGVSANTFAVHTSRGAWVVKQALAQLKVATAWHADPARILNEAAALTLASELFPENVPPITLIDPQNFILVMEHAPQHLHDWKSELMAGGSADSASTAARLGEILGVLHHRTLDNPSLAAQFGDTEAFVDLRIDPFHRTVARQLPSLAGRLAALAEELTTSPRCLVHGDYSPKNVLSSGAQAWVIDWEVAHFGNPIFDLAFMLAHLVCKAVYAPSRSHVYRMCAQDFVASYTRTAPRVLLPDPVGLVRHTAAIILARTDGKSLAAYLTSSARESARQLALGLITTQYVNDSVVQCLWSELT